MIINSKDPYTFTVNTPLTVKDSKGNNVTLGTTLISYEIRTYRDIRNLGSTLAYQVLCTQRIIIPNSTPYTIGSQNVTAFDDYPAVISNNISITNTGGSTPILVKYTPKTFNASVNISTSTGSGINASASHQYTSGSSTSQADTYGIQVSLGFFGDAPTGGVSADYSHTSSSEKSQSNTNGNDTGRNSNISAEESMSVKDWACYSYIDTQDSSPTWIWGQEYPWDVIKFNNNNGGANILLPDSVVPLLCDSTQALPPSQLSLFGVDFTMKSVWVLEPSSVGTITINHSINYCTATHSYVAGSSGTPPTPPSVTASIGAQKTFTYDSPAIDLYTYGLDPILSNKVAIVGFVPNKFIIQPAPATDKVKPIPFNIISQSNNMMIKDTSDYSKLTSSDVNAGFSPSETALSATFTKNCTSLQIQISFKIMDTVNNYTLFMKHWKTNTSDVILQMIINGDTQNPITKYVDAAEAEGGENNLLSIVLRNQDYASVDYHDYLQLGLNTIQINFTPIDGNFSTCGYQIRAISIEKD